MTTRLRFATTTLLSLTLYAPALAQPDGTPDCADPLHQAEITMCARADAEAADAEMADVLAQTLAQFREQDRAYADLGPEYVGAEMLMAASQKSWTSNRSDFCAARGLTNYGGSMRPAVVATCFTMMARSRTEELRWLID